MQPTHLHLVRSACLYALRRAPADVHVVQLHGSSLRSHRFTSAVHSELGGEGARCRQYQSRHYAALLLRVSPRQLSEPVKSPQSNGRGASSPAE